MRSIISTDSLNSRYCIMRKLFVVVLMFVALQMVSACGGTDLSDRAFRLIIWGPNEKLTFDIGPKRIEMPALAKVDFNPIFLPVNEGQGCYSTGPCSWTWSGTIVVTSARGERASQYCSFYTNGENDVIVERDYYSKALYIRCN